MECRFISVTTFLKPCKGLFDLGSTVLLELIVWNSESGRTDACLDLITGNLGRSLANYDPANKEVRGVRVKSLLTESPESFTVSVEDVRIAILDGTFRYTVSVIVISGVLLGSNDNLPVVRGVSEVSSINPNGELLSLVERNENTTLVMFAQLKITSGGELPDRRLRALTMAKWRFRFAKTDKDTPEARWTKVQQELQQEQRTR